MTDLPILTAAGARYSPRDSAGLLLMLLAAAGAVATFWIGFGALARAWSTPEYSHGPLIPVLSFLLFLRQLKNTPAPSDPVRLRWPGLLITAFALLVAALGNLAGVPDIVTYAMIIWIYGVLLIGFGWHHGRQFWPPVVHLVFMLPLPAFLYWKLSISLQFFSSELGVELIRMLGIPVFLDGNIIDLGIYKLHVAEACSGLRYLFPILSFSYVFAVLYRGPMWHKAVLLLSAAPITIAMNSLRIGIIGVLVENYGIEQAEGFLHFFEGWVVFLICVLLLIGLAHFMRRVGGDRRPLHQVLDLDTSGLGSQLAALLRPRASAALAAGAIATAVTGAAWHLAPDRDSAGVSREPLALFPHDLGTWTAGPMQRLEPRIAAILQADDYFSAAYASPDASQPVDLFMAYYGNQLEDAGIHSPEACIPASGWEMSRITRRTVSVPGADGNAVEFQVNRAVIQSGLARQLVYYWFKQRDRHLTSDYVVKAATVLDALARGRADGALVRLITPIGPGESVAAADERLTAFLGQTFPVLPRFVPD